MVDASSDRIESVLKELGLQGPYEDHLYYHSMERRFKKKADRFMTGVDNLLDGVRPPTTDDWQRLYRLKNADTNMSAFVTSHQCTTLYRSFLIWLCNHVEEWPRTITELGCDNGMLSLAIAKLSPESAIQGIDSIGKAISNAKQMKKRFNVSNAEFRMTDLVTPMNDSVGTDLVLAPWVMHDLLPSVIGTESAPDKEGCFLENLASLVASGGTLISVNRFPFADEQVSRLDRLLATVGFSQNLQDTIEAEEGGGLSRFPVACYSRSS